MPPQEFAFAMPGTEEMTETALGLAGAAVTGVVEGIIIKMAPELGALETPFTWATILGVPLVGVAGAFFVKGMLGEICKGVAYAGTGYAASVVPAMVMPEGLFGKKLTAEQRAALAAGRDVKRLPPGSPLNAPQRAQAAAAKAAIGSWAYTPEEAKGFVGQGHTVRDYA